MGNTEYLKNIHVKAALVDLFKLKRVDTVAIENWLIFFGDREEARKRYNSTHISLNKLEFDTIADWIESFEK